MGVLFCVLWIWYRKVKPFWPFTAAAVGVVTDMSSLRPSENHCRAWNVLSELFLSQASPAAAHYGLPDVAENRREHGACSVYSGYSHVVFRVFRMFAAASDEKSRAWV